MLAIHIVWRTEMLLKWIWFFFLFGISHRESCSFFTLGFQVKSQALKHKFKYNKAQLSDSCSGFCLIYLKREENQSRKKFCFLFLWPSHSVGETSKWWKHFIRYIIVFHQNQQPPPLAFSSFVTVLSFHNHPSESVN